MSVVSIGLDLAKSVFQVHGVNASGHAVLRRKLNGDLKPIPGMPRIQQLSKDGSVGVLKPYSTTSDSPTHFWAGTRLTRRMGSTRERDWQPDDNQNQAQCGRQTVQPVRTTSTTEASDAHTAQSSRVKYCKSWYKRPRPN